MNTFNELQVQLETYYGFNYVDIEFALIVKYLREHGVEPMEAFERIALHHSKSYKSLPDVAMFREALDSITKSNIEIEASNAWDVVTRKIHRYKSIVFEDPRVTFAFDAIGGISGYCDSEVKFLPLMRNRFIEAFKHANNSRGKLPTYAFHAGLDDSDAKMIFVGNEERIRIEMQKTHNPTLSTISSGLRVTFDESEITEMRAEAANDAY